MNKFPLLFVLVLNTLLGFAKENFRLLHSDSRSATLEYNFDGPAYKEVIIDNQSYYKIYSDKCVPVLNAGFPEVLRSSVSIAIPHDCVPVMEIVSAEYSEVNNRSLIPSKGSLKRNVNPNDVPYSFGSVYSLDEFYPQTPAQLNQAYTLRSQEGISLSVFPVLTNPVTKTLRVYTRLVVKIIYKNAKGKKLELSAPAFTSAEEKEILSQRFINFTPAIQNAKTAYTPINEFGSMLVISAPTLSSAVQPLVDWKNQKGIKTTLVTTSVTGISGASVKSYIQNYYASNPDLLYVLLVGDHQNINAFNAGSTGQETKWSDSKYGMLTGNDFYPEVMVGRFSSTTVADITTMVNRTLEYEKNPMSGNWYTKAIGIGSDEGDGIGDEGEADWQHSRNIGNKLVADGYSYYHEFFDGTQNGNDLAGNPTSSMVVSAMNEGASLFFYTGHGDQNTCVTSGYGSSHVMNGSNNGMYPFSLQVACNNGTFHNGTCFSEVFLRAKNNAGPTGGIGSCGSTILMAWAEPMDTQDELGDIISNQYSGLKRFTLGGLFYCAQMHMLDMYPTTTGEEVMETWLMFGDPSCVLRTKDPGSITATHANCIVSSATNFSVSTATGQAKYATLSQNNAIIGTAQVSGANTSIALTGTFSTSQDLLLTITEFNKVPYTATLSTCFVTSVTEEDQYSRFYFENIFENELKVSYSGDAPEAVHVELLDIQGRVVTEANAEVTPSSFILLNTSSAGKGIYILKVSDSNGKLLKTGKVIRS